ncbi:VWA domain-containing protein [Shewanella colwelliana]|uniref:vWA domain-containing protein n=1 Tax=Shewanella colwelliana TaxID=23 RepID=UPI00299ED73E|nr:VWA domain-containing protein [Shewanella colwelliana]MDX1282160.1 VWA domain-containing protein [Shewanella colwelliana]
MIHLLRPEWLLALLPLALLLFVARRSTGQQSNWNKYIAPHLAKRLVGHSSNAKRNDLKVIAFCWLVAVIALSGPAFTKQSLPVFEANQGRVIVMDMSLSMYATDLVPNRLTQAKFKATDLITGLKEGETGLIAYAGDAFTISPLTRDKATLLNLLPTLSPQIMPVLGSNLPVALTQAKTLLSQGGHLRGDVILLTDGVSTTQVNEAKKVFEDSQYRLSIIALGSSQGAAIRLPDGQLMRDKVDQVVVAKTDYSLLKEIAVDNGGNLFPYRADGEDLVQLYQSLTQSQSNKKSDLEGEIWQDAGPFIALLLLLPALMNFRNAVAALACLLLFTPPTPVYANSWQSPWQTNDQRAMQAYEQQDYQQAAALFSDPNWQGAALYRNGQYEEALAQFEQDNSATGLYNQGNSLMQLQNYQAAIEKYQQALKKQSDLTAASENLALAEQLDAQQKQQNQQNQQQDDQNQQQDDQQGNQQNDSQGESQNQGQQDHQPTDEQPQSEQQQSSSDQSQSQEDNAQQQDASSQQSNEASSANNEAPMSAEPETKTPTTASSPQDEETEPDDTSSAQQMADAQPQSAPQEQPPSDASQALQVADAPAPDDLPLEMQRALSSVIDDPQVLLRNKMQLEYQKRRRQGQTSKDTEQW